MNAGCQPSESLSSLPARLWCALRFLTFLLGVMAVSGCSSLVSDKPFLTASNSDFPIKADTAYSMMTSNEHDPAKGLIVNVRLKDGQYYAETTDKDGKFSQSPFWLKKISKQWYIFQGANKKEGESVKSEYSLVSSVDDNVFVAYGFSGKASEVCKNLPDEITSKWSIILDKDDCGVQSFDALQAIFVYAYGNGRMNPALTFTPLTTGVPVPPLPQNSGDEAVASRGGTACSAESVKALVVKLAKQWYEQSPNGLFRASLGELMGYKTLSADFTVSGIRHRGTNLDPASGPVSCLGILQAKIVLRHEQDAPEEHDSSVDLPYSVEQSEDGSAVVHLDLPSEN